MFSKRPEYPSPMNRQLPSINSESSIHGVDTSAPRTINRDRRAPSNLSPYIAEIEVPQVIAQRRKKVRSVLRDTSTRSKQQKERRREQSLNKFRIQECSYYSNQRNDSSMRARAHNDSQQDTSTLSNGNLNVTVAGSTKTTIDKKRGFSRKKVLPEQLTIEHPSLTIIQKDEHLKNLYSKLRSKCESDTTKPDQKRGFRRGKYVVGESESEGNAQSNLRKIAYTVNNIEQVSRELAPTEQLRNRNKTIMNINPAGDESHTINNQRRNFRRNKYEMQSQIISGGEKEQTKYSSVDIQKKESNTSLIRELDIQTQKEAEQQDRMISLKIKKILDKSLEKSTEEYFKEHSEPRNLKSRNQIDIYMSTVKNPLYRCSQASTLNVSDKKEELYVSTVIDSGKQDLLNYDFNLEQDVAPAKPIRDNTACFLLPEQSEEGSMERVAPINQFEKERKEAERRFANHDNVRIDWSDEDLDCTVKAEDLDC